jgi:hypothetical protein
VKSERNESRVSARARCKQCDSLVEFFINGSQWPHYYAGYEDHQAHPGQMVSVAEPKEDYLVGLSIQEAQDVEDALYCYKKTLELLSTLSRDVEDPAELFCRIEGLYTSWKERPMGGNGDDAKRDPKDKEETKDKLLKQAEKEGLIKKDDKKGGSDGKS